MREREPKEKQEVCGWAGEEARCVLVNWVIPRTCPELSCLPLCLNIIYTAQKLQVLKSTSLLPVSCCKKGQCRGQRYNLWKEFFPARVKLLPPVFVFISIINQIQKKPLKQIQRTKNASCSIALSSLWLPKGFSLQPALFWKLCWILLSISHNFLRIGVL